MLKIKKIWQKKLFKNYFIFCITFLLLEIIFRSIANLSILSFSMLRVFIGVNILSLIFGYISKLLPRKGSMIFNILIILIFSIYGVAQLGFKNYLGVYLSFGSSSQAGTVTSYFMEYLRSFHWFYYLIFIPFILVLLYYILVDKKVSVDLPKLIKNKRYYINKSITLGSLIVLIILYFITLTTSFMQDKKIKATAYQIFQKPVSPTLAISNFGFTMFSFLDIKESLAPGKEITNDVYYDPSNIKNYNKEDVIVPQVTIDNEKWKNIIENETDDNKNLLNKYFISKKATESNEYTGLFKDKNLIMIMLESGSNLIINEEYYPNITKLYNEGWHFTNYYSPRNTCSTINNEFSNLTGLYTISNNCTAKEYKDNVYFESIFNLFNNAGYDTKSYHNYTEHYYPRSTIHPNMGVGEYFGVEKLNIPYSTVYGDWPSDEDFIDSYLNYLDQYDKDKPFMNFLTTVTSHQTYMDDSKFNNLYRDDFPDKYAYDVRSYMSKVRVLDNAIGKLVDGLKDRDLLDDTVIVMFADHYPYGLRQDNLSDALGVDISVDNNAENVPYIIYSPSIDSKTFSQYTMHVNTTPTIANLFGLDFDSRIYEGSDVLSKDYESLVIFDDASWKNEYAYYDAGTSEISYYTDKTYEENEILEINERVNYRLSMSSLAIKNDYFKYLDELLNNDDNDEDKVSVAIDE